MTIRNTAGIQAPIVINGVVMSVGAETAKMGRRRFRTSQKMLNGETVVDGAWCFDKQPTCLWSWSVSLQWPNGIDGEDYATFEDLASSASFADVFIPKTEFAKWNGNGTETTFRMPRRMAQDASWWSTLPAQVRAELATVVTVDGTDLVSGYSFGSADALNRKLLTITSPPSAGTENVRVRYAPLLYMLPADDDVSFAPGFLEARALQLEER